MKNSLKGSENCTAIAAHGWVSSKHHLSSIFICSLQFFIFNLIFQTLVHRKTLLLHLLALVEQYFRESFDETGYPQSPCKSRGTPPTAVVPADCFKAAVLPVALGFGLGSKLTIELCVSAETKAKLNVSFWRENCKGGNYFKLWANHVVSDCSIQ